MILVLVSFGVAETFEWEGNSTIRVCIEGGGDVTATFEEGSGIFRLIDWKVRAEGTQIEAQGLEHKLFWKVEVEPQGYVKVKVDATEGNVGVCPTDELAIALGIKTDELNAILALAGVISGALWMWGVVYLVKT
jgi:hypothetical protein